MSSLYIGQSTTAPAGSWLRRSTPNTGGTFASGTRTTATTSPGPVDSTFAAGQYFAFVALSVAPKKQQIEVLLGFI
jgi:hypothetical protein